jgi:hypothetical protein
MTTISHSGSFNKMPNFAQAESVYISANAINQSSDSHSQLAQPFTHQSINGIASKTNPKSMVNFQKPYDPLSMNQQNTVSFNQ